MRFRAPDEHEAEERAWQVVGAAYAEREPVAWPRRHVRPLVAGALVAAVVAAVLSPPGRSVVHSLRKAVGVQQAEPALFSLPTPGQLLVTSREGAWLVHPDGSKRLLGHYRDAAFSPHGRFVAATRANQLVALDPKGNVHWTLARPSPRFPAWTGTSTDTRIAYLSSGQLRIVAGDGTGDRAVGRAALVAPAWRPGPGRVVAYSDGRRTVVYDADRGRVLRRLSNASTKLAWSDDGRSCCRSRRTGRVSTPARRSSQRTTRPMRPPTATPRSRETRSSRHARPATAATSSRSRPAGRSSAARASSTSSPPLRTAAGCSRAGRLRTSGRSSGCTRGRSSASPESRSSSGARPQSEDGAARADRRRPRRGFRGGRGAAAAS